jgi:hypothetical protein
MSNATETKVRRKRNADKSKGITLISGGTLSLSIDVNLFTLTDSDRKFVFGLMDQMKRYEDGETPQ